MSWRLDIEPIFDNVGPQVDAVEAGLEKLSTLEPATLKKFLKSRTQKDTTELHEALQKLWHKCPRHLQWKQKASTKATSKTGASDLTSAMQVVAPPRREGPAVTTPSAPKVRTEGATTPRSGTPRAGTPRTPPRTPPRGSVGTPRTSKEVRVQTPRTSREAPAQTPRSAEARAQTPPMPPITAPADMQPAGPRAATAPGGSRQRRASRDGSVTPLQQEIPDPRPYVAAAWEEGDADEETAEDRARQERLDRAHIITRRKQMMSTYRDSFRDPDPTHRENKNKAPCFQRVLKPEYLEVLDKWQDDEADEEYVKKFADGCRAVQSMQTYATKHRLTEYTGKYLGEVDPHLSLFKQRELNVKDREGMINLDLRHRNYSRIPVGSIYEMDSWEMEASKEREREIERKMRDQVRQQEQMCADAKAKKFHPVNLCMYTDTNNVREGLTEVQRLFRIQNLANRKWTSEYRQAFIGRKQAYGTDTIAAKGLSVAPTTGMI